MGLRCKTGLDGQYQYPSTFYHSGNFHGILILFSFVFFSFEELFFPHFGGKSNNFLKVQQLRWVKIFKIILRHLGTLHH